MVEQPYQYQRRELAEPDWRRLPGWAKVTSEEWESAQWQRAHSVKNARQLRDVTGGGLSEEFLADLERDQRERATMSMLLPPQMLNTIAPSVPASGNAAARGEFTDAWYADPVRRYMLPVFSDRQPEWPSHPRATRDSLHETAMWTVEGLTHRYPTKVLVELRATCPLYCGHCTRMDLVGNSTPSVRQVPVHRHARRTGSPRCSPTCVPLRPCATSSCRAVMWQIFRGRGSRPSCPRC